MDSSNLGCGSTYAFLPNEVLFDILVRLPGKDIGRLRTICQRWRDLTSDPIFIKAHAARHRDQFIAASFRGDREHIHVMDLSGRVVKRLPIRISESKHYLLYSFDLVGLADVDGGCSLIDPVAGATTHLPKMVLKGSTNWEFCYDDDKKELERCVFRAGRVDSTGESKVLRIVCRAYADVDDFDEHHPVSSVLTINGGDGAQWRETRSHPAFLVNMDCMDGGVVVGSTIHFFWSRLYPTATQMQLMRDGVDVDFISSFDLAAEEWTSIPGPRPLDDSKLYSMCYDSSLAELDGYLVVVHHGGETMDLWFLADIGNRLWEKKYSICAESVLQNEVHAKPLLLLDDGRIVIFLGVKGLLLLYDPTTNMVSEMETRCLGKVTPYVGSLLSLQSDAKMV
ncbi:hypothetical protein HU200_042061 [Digitaria exilis]|uniref:F-box domain-containing protein n=1 Tax=Digitaria exilis TaxID=1010633 RepID=A0A835EG84_9POAL|nr:hypothetical protein HU200_042061 [Digitaria exilis]